VRISLHLETNAGAADIDLVTLVETLPTLSARRYLDGAVLTKLACTVFAAIIRDAIVADRCIEADVSVPALNGRVGFVCAFFEDDVISANEALAEVGEFR
jgi:hypothetical protein